MKNKKKEGLDRLQLLSGSINHFRNHIPGFEMYILLSINYQKRIVKCYMS